MTDVGRMRVASEVLGDLVIVEIGRGRAGVGGGGSRQSGSTRSHQKYQLADFRS